ncbi:MAG: hypothetical protein KC619_10795 [Myxococcales bacterium]|nr:hypothetical protein [Myxococcales bacterium]
MTRPHPLVIAAWLALAAGCGNEARTPQREGEAPAAMRSREDSAPSPLAISPGAFTAVEHHAEADRAHTRYSSPPGSGCMVTVDWWRPMPPHPGGPMTEVSRRPATVDGHAAEVVRTSYFDGVAQEVDVLFLRGDGFQARFLFEDCGRVEQDLFLRGVDVLR